MNIEIKKQKRKFIEIEPMDLGDFTDVALLVDNEDFIDEVEEMRNKYGLAYNFPVRNYKLTESFVYKRHSNSKIKSVFEADIERIRKLFNRPPHFKPVIEASIIYGAVGKNTYSKAYLEEQEITTNINPEVTPDIKYSIVIHAGTRGNDILRVLSEFKEKVRINFKGSEKERKNYHFGYWADLSLQKMQESHPSFDIIRGWHTRRENDETPLQIALSITGDTYEEYKELLKKTKPFSKYDEKENIKDQRKLQRILSQRNSIKELLRRYRQLLKTSFL